MTVESGLRSIPDVCELTRTGPPGRPPRLLIEVPHGATRARHFDRLARRMQGAYPPDLREFFFVNTDVGAPECAREVAEALGGRDVPVLVVRGLVPRTFIDCNRVVGEPLDGQVTPGLPEYVGDPRDVETLTRLHTRYQEVVQQAYELVCGQGARALMLHTFAPRSVKIERIDDGIVNALREAYRPGRYETWERRPAVEFITEDTAGRCLAPRSLIDAMKTRFAAIAVEAAENVTYRLHPHTMGQVYSARYPGQVICIELNRELLVDPFTPFREMRVDPRAARRLAMPIVEILAVDQAQMGG